MHVKEDGSFFHVQPHVLQEVFAHHLKQRMAWRHGEITTIPGGEDDATVLARVDTALAEVLSGPEPAMVVTHHGVLRLVAVRAGAEIDTLIPNLGGFQFEVEGAELARPEPLPPLPDTPADDTGTE